MDDVIVATNGRLFHWHREEVTSVTDGGDLPVLRLGSEVTCGIGATTLSRKKSLPRDFKNKPGVILVIHLEATTDDAAVNPRVIELGVQLDRTIAWFSPAELTLTDDAQEVPRAS